MTPKNLIILFTCLTGSCFIVSLLTYGAFLRKLSTFAAEANQRSKKRKVSLPPLLRNLSLTSLTGYTVFIAVSFILSLLQALFYVDGIDLSYSTSLCAAQTYSVCFFMLGKLSMYVFFIGRVYYSFLSSSLAYNRNLLISVTSIFFVIMAVIGTLYIYSLYIDFENLGNIDDPVACLQFEGSALTQVVIFCGATFDSLWSFTCLLLFVIKLKKLMTMMNDLNQIRIKRQRTRELRAAQKLSHQPQHQPSQTTRTTQPSQQVSQQVCPQPAHTSSRSTPNQPVTSNVSCTPGSPDAADPIADSNVAIDSTSNASNASKTELTANLNDLSRNDHTKLQSIASDTVSIQADAALESPVVPQTPLETPSHTPAPVVVRDVPLRLQNSAVAAPEKILYAAPDAATSPVAKDFRDSRGAGAAGAARGAVRSGATESKEEEDVSDAVGGNGNSSRRESHMAKIKKKLSKGRKKRKRSDKKVKYINKFVPLMLKMTILSFWCAMSTLILGYTLWVQYPTLSGVIDSTVNMVCVLLSFKFSEPIYQKMCACFICCHNDLCNELRSVGFENKNIRQAMKDNEREKSRTKTKTKTTRSTVHVHVDGSAGSAGGLESGTGSAQTGSKDDTDDTNDTDDTDVLEDAENVPGMDGVDEEASGTLTESSTKDNNSSGVDVIHEGDESNAAEGVWPDGAQQQNELELTSSQFNPV